MKRECSLIRDLLPLYVEQMVSEESKKIIEEHLAQCPSCKKVYEEMTERELGMRPEMGENDGSEAAESFRRFVKKEKRRERMKIAVSVVLSFGLAIFLAFAIPAGILGAITLPLWITHTSEDISDYDRGSFKGDSGFLIFPEEVREDRVTEYYYSYREGLFDEDVQLYLQCEYTPEEFQEECLRLEQAHVIYRDGGQRRRNGTRYNTGDYMLPAYEAIQGVDHAYEYALLDEENGRIDYIFLQFVDEDDLVFAREKLPYGYGRDYTVDPKLSPYNMYAFPEEEGEYKGGYITVYH